DDQRAQHLVRRRQDDGGNVEQPAGENPHGDDEDDAGNRVEELRNETRCHCGDASSAAGATMPRVSLAIRSAAVNAFVKRTFWLRGEAMGIDICLTTRAGRWLKTTTLSDR